MNTIEFTTKILHLGIEVQKLFSIIQNLSNVIQNKIVTSSVPRENLIKFLHTDLDVEKTLRMLPLFLSLCNTPNEQLLSSVLFSYMDERA